MISKSGLKQATLNIVKFSINVLLLSIISIILISAWLFLIEPGLIITKNITLKVPKWHKEHKDLKIAILADLHVGSPSITLKKLEYVVKQTNKEKPDLVLLLGDFISREQDVIGGKLIAPRLIAAELSKLEAPNGIIAILGNHDWWFDGECVREALKKENIIVLEDSVIRITKNNRFLWIAGLGDLWT